MVKENSDPITSLATSIPIVMSITMLYRPDSEFLNDKEDKFVWKLTDSGSFSVKSMCTDFMNGRTVYLEA